MMVSIYNPLAHLGMKTVEVRIFLPTQPAVFLTKGCMPIEYLVLFSARIIDWLCRIPIGVKIHPGCQMRLRFVAAE